MTDLYESQLHIDMHVASRLRATQETRAARPHAADVCDANEVCATMKRCPGGPVPRAATSRGTVPSAGHMPTKGWLILHMSGEAVRICTQEV